MTMKNAPFRVRGRVMVGLKSVARAFNVRASYDPRTARIDVLTPGIGKPTLRLRPPPQPNNQPETLAPSGRFA